MSNNIFTSVHGQLNHEMEMAMQIVQTTGQSLFLTGKAGTGKTTFLHHLRRLCDKRMVVLAPTGIAAINAHGQTIHSFFQLPLTPYIPTIGFAGASRHHERFNREKLQLIRTIDLIVIDEISMVRADLLDAVDSVLRRYRSSHLPFGGVQMVMIGDLQQLAPVVKPEEWQLLSPHYPTPYFFSSQALNSIDYETIELKKVYRQSDDRFLEILNRVRNATADSSTLKQLNSRHIAGFNPPHNDGYIRLTTHNRRANEINAIELGKLKTPAVTFEARIEGTFPEYSYPTEKKLTLKEGAQVMFLRNDPEKTYYNGLMGTVTHLNDLEVTVRPIGTENNEEITVEPAVWENTKFTVDDKTSEVKETIEGRFAQLPLRLAWAITIHKSQGLTFDKAIIDAASSFAHGQTYVALSRCRSLDGLVLETPIPQSAIINDSNVNDFTLSHQTSNVSDERLLSLQTDYTYHCMEQVFGMESLKISFDALHRIVDEYLSRDYPKLFEEFNEMANNGIVNLINVDKAFARQYRGINPFYELFDERVASACTYFSERLTEVSDLIDKCPKQTDNKLTTKRLQTALNDLYDLIDLRLKIMSEIKGKRFTPRLYSAAKARAAAGCRDQQKEKKRQKRSEKENNAMAADIVNPKLYEALRQWRLEEMKRLEVPAFVVLYNRTLMWISANVPTTVDELKMCPGFGKTKLSKYAHAILDITKRYQDEKAQ